MLDFWQFHYVHLVCFDTYCLSLQAKATPSKQKPPAQNGKSPKPNTPALKQVIYIYIFFLVTNLKTLFSGTICIWHISSRFNRFIFYLLQEKTPKGKGDKPKTSPSPKAALTPPEIKAKMMEAVKKVRSFPEYPYLSVILGSFYEKN